MKTINETFDDDEYNALIIVKKDLSWHDFILTLVKKRGVRNEINKRD